MKPAKPPKLPDELVKVFVSAGHNNLPEVQRLLKEQPGLLNACWDLGGGDFETALEGAGAAVVINRQSDVQLAIDLKNAIGSFVVNEKLLASLSTAALNITNGCGVNLVVAQMLGK